MFMLKTFTKKRDKTQAPVPNSNLLIIEAVDMQNSHLLDDRTFPRFTSTCN
jgi:hypothetical protein